MPSLMFASATDFDLDAMSELLNEEFRCEINLKLGKHKYLYVYPKEVHSLIATLTAPSQASNNATMDDMHRLKAMPDAFRVLLENRQLRFLLCQTNQAMQEQMDALALKLQTLGIIQFDASDGVRELV